MTFRDYIRAIISTKIFIGSQEQFVMDLFRHAGTLKPVERDTAKSWISSVDSNGFRNCKIRNYFEDNTINEADFIKFISCRANTSWPELQNAFRSTNKDCIVNLDTNDPDIFYWSLLNQFQKIHGLPLSEMPVKGMLKLFKNALENSDSSIFFEDYENILENTKLSNKLYNFLDILEADIIEPFALCYSGSSMYQKILELHNKLKEFIVMHSSSMYNLMSYYSSYYDEINYCHQRIDTLYCEILDIHPTYEDITIGQFSFDEYDIQK